MIGRTTKDVTVTAVETAIATETMTTEVEITTIETAVETATTEITTATTTTGIETRIPIAEGIVTMIMTETEEVVTDFNSLYFANSIKVKIMI
jgi:hypothetical protein